MRESISTTWVFGLVITFTLIFSGFLVIALTYAKAYKIKNEMTSIIEKYEGLTYTSENKDGSKGLGSIAIINNYLHNNGYNTMGSCGTDEDIDRYTIYGVYDINATDPKKSIEIVKDSSKNYYYCVTRTKGSNLNTIFLVRVFFNFNLPVFGHIRKYNISGQTNEINHAFAPDENGKVVQVYTATSSKGFK